MRIFLAFLLAVLPTSALCGAWPREQGNFFAAMSLESTYDRSALTWDDPSEEPPLARNFLKFYGEYGLTDRYTLGVDLERDYLFAQQQNLAFLAASVVPSDWINRISVELGVGEREGPFGTRGQDESEPIVRPGVSYGRGFETRWGQGWTAADFKAEYRFNTAETAYKLDLTLGLQHGDGTLHYAQVQTSNYPGDDPAARLLLSRVSKVNRVLWLETGLLAGLVTDESVGIRIALWAEF